MTSTHRQFTLSPNSEYSRHFDPVRRVELRVGDVMMECVRKKEAISLESWSELKECPFCGEPTGNLMEVPPPSPLKKPESYPKKPEQDIITLQYEASRWRFAGVPILALVILLLIACLGAGGMIVYASLNNSNMFSSEVSLTLQPIAAGATSFQPSLEPLAEPEPTVVSPTIRPTIHESASSPTILVQEIVVQANQERTYTGFHLTSGQNITIQFVQGKWRAGPPPTWPFYGPSGDPQVPHKETFPVQDRPIMGLIGGIANNKPFWVGLNAEYQSPFTGELWLGPNDDDYSDNIGGITVIIQLGE